MNPRREIKGVVAAVVLALATHACAPKHTRGPGAEEAPTQSRIPATSKQDRRGGGLQDAFLRDPPSCVVLLPVEAKDRSALSPRLVEAAVERFLAVRFDRLIAGARRDRMVRHLALDLRHPGDLTVLASQTNCRHALSSKVGGGGLAYAVIWAEHRVSLSLSLRRIDGDGEILWSAKADGARGDGGLPLSPLGLASALVRAGRVAEDEDQARSLLDDLLRRMTADLPDVRGLAHGASGSLPRDRFQTRRFSMNAGLVGSKSRR